ncbi:hypothetical protein CBM2637_B110338 [Cupriavidus taiwanensis]|nr:hypothetical protein CBM2637_B110338 [Cupriavidus taiwanensis]
MAELVERHQQLQVTQLDIGAQRAVDLYHARSLANQKVMKQCQFTIGLLCWAPTECGHDEAGSAGRADNQNIGDTRK